MVIVLRIVHILGGVFWVGSVVFASILLTPALKAAGLATMGAGIWLLLIDSAMQPGVWMQSGTGMTFSIGGALAILAFLVGMAVNMPTSKRLAALGSAAAARGGPPTPEEGAELQRLQGRMATANQIVMVLLLLATAAMAVARYIQ